MKTFTIIETCIQRISEYSYLYCRVSNHEEARNFAHFMAENWQKELDYFPKEWVDTVKLIIDLR